MGESWWKVQHWLAFHHLLLMHDDDDDDDDEVEEDVQCQDQKQHATHVLF